MEKYYIFNPIYNKYPQGTCKKGTTVKYELKVAGIVNVDYITFNYAQDGGHIVKLRMQKGKNENGYISYYAEHKFTRAGQYWYHFEVFTDKEHFYLEKQDNFDVEKTYTLHDQYMQLVYAKDSQTTSSYQGGVMYHIFVDRFNSVGKVTPRPNAVMRKDWGGEVNSYENYEKIANDEFFGGNLKGIIAKLDYLKSLNVNSIYLSPIFEATSNHKYDTGDYSKIDSMFGTKQDLQQLIDQAKERGIGIILDGVFNHTGSDSVYFNKLNRYKSVGAFQSKNSPYYDWYTFTDYPNKYECWWSVSILPQINESNPSFIEYMTGKDGIIPGYMKMGLLGFRLDVVDELDQVFLDALCKSVREVRNDALIIGEVWEDASNKIAYSERRRYFLGDGLDSVMNYPLKNAIIDYIKTGNTKMLLSTIYMIKDHYPTNVQNNLMNILGTHDTARILTVLGLDNVSNAAAYRKDNIYLTPSEKVRAEKLLKQASLLQYTLMGVPCIYYGDEAGVQGIGDPYNRGCFPWDNINQDINDWYKNLGVLRNNPAFKQGSTNILYCDQGVICFERVFENNRIVVAINKSHDNFELNLLSPHINFFTNKSINHITLKHDEYVVLIKE